MKILYPILILLVCLHPSVRGQSISSPFFLDLPFGNYMITITDVNGCVDTTAVTVFAGSPPQIQEVQVTNESCEGKTASLSIQMITTGNYQYSLNNVLWQNENTFQDLSRGMYTIYVRDEYGCTAQRDVEINAHASFSLQSVSSTPADCGDNTGTLLIEISGGTEPFQIYLNDLGPQAALYFDELNSGTYLLHVSDANGCTLDSFLTISQTRCALFIPNMFSPNGDGINDLFQLHTSSETDIMITRFLVFDRWGNNVYEKYAIPIHAETGWWDGTHKRWTMNPGSYAYFIEARFTEHETETYKGTITLIR